MNPSAHFKPVMRGGMIAIISSLALIMGIIAPAVATPGDGPVPSETCVSDGKIAFFTSDEVLADPSLKSEIQNLYLRTKKATESPRPWVRMKFGFDLILDGAHCAGDRIEISAPRQLGPNGEPVKMTAPDGTVIATAEYRDWKVTVTLTKAVENPNYFGFRGDAWWEVSLLANVEVGENVLEWSVDGKVVRTPVNVAPCDNCSTIPAGPAKWGWASGGAGGVTLQFPTATYDGQVFTWSDELLSSNQSIDCNKLQSIATAYSTLDQWGSATDRKKIPFTVSSCSSIEISGTITVDKGWKAQVGLSLILDPKDPGPWADRATFVSGETWTRNATVRRAESGGSGMYQSRTPVVATTPTLKGSATCTQCGDDSQQAFITIPSTEGVRYLLNDREVVEGEYPLEAGVATVKAVAIDPSRTILEGETVWRFSIEACKCPDIKVSLASPKVTPGVCRAGSGSSTPSAPLVTMPSTEGVAYSKHSVSSEGGVVTISVTATLAEGYTLAAELPEGWNRVSDQEAVFTTSIPQPDCRIKAAPADPVVTPGVCQAGSAEPTEPVVTTPSTEGVVYGKPSVRAEGSKITIEVTAQAKDGFVLDLSEASPGWVLQTEDGTAVFSKELEQPVCPAAPPTPEPAPAPTPKPEPAPKPTPTPSPAAPAPAAPKAASRLANTGSDAQSLLVIGAVLAATAAGVTTVHRRGRRG